VPVPVNYRKQEQKVICKILYMLIYKTKNLNSSWLMDFLLGINFKWGE